MKLSDIKTIDELREFSSKTDFYYVCRYFPYDVEHMVINQHLAITFDLNNKLLWCANILKGYLNDSDIYDNELEATKDSLKLRIESCKKTLKNDIEKLKQLEINEESDNADNQH